MEVTMALLEDIVDFCKKELKIPQEILVSVEVEDISEDNVKGWTVDSAEDDEYDIEIDTGLSFKETILTLCHEMVHVLQFSTKHLLFPSKSKFFSSPETGVP